MVLGAVCTALAFLVFFVLIGEAGPVRATVITYLNPVVAVALGVVFLHEHAGWSTAAGAALILSGSVLATGRLGGPGSNMALRRLGRRRSDRDSGGPGAGSAGVSVPVDEAAAGPR